jgi:hypothetical protein
VFVPQSSMHAQPRVTTASGAPQQPMLYTETSNYDPRSVSYGTKLIEDLFVPESVAEELFARQSQCQAVPEPDDPRLQTHPLPPTIDRFHTLGFLDAVGAIQAPSRAFAATTTMYKGISAQDGKAYALRRIDVRYF